MSAAEISITFKMILVMLSVAVAGGILFINDFFKEKSSEAETTPH